MDVRPPIQYGIVHMPGAVNIPWKGMERNPDAAVKMCQENDKVFIMCRRGNASKEATQFLVDKMGVKNVVNVEGGIN